MSTKLHGIFVVCSVLSGAVGLLSSNLAVHLFVSALNDLHGRMKRFDSYLFGQSEPEASAAERRFDRDASQRRRFHTVAAVRQTCKRQRISLSAWIAPKRFLLTQTSIWTACGWTASLGKCTDVGLVVQTFRCKRKRGIDHETWLGNSNTFCPHTFCGTSP